MCSSAAIAREGWVEMIIDECGSRSTPSVVAFVDDRLLVGDCAKAQASLNPRDALFCIKRFLGRKIDDPEVVEERVPALCFAARAMDLESDSCKPNPRQPPAPSFKAMGGTTLRGPAVGIPLCAVDIRTPMHLAASNH
mmetsp:Transcript_11889/g.24491  ORF Transcript_11889/g.24491 Transcript_11889/m.24491 type:complete len:138 (-) Transcript_11889:587-1000(-)